MALAPSRVEHQLVEIHRAAPLTARISRPPMSRSPDGTTSARHAVKPAPSPGRCRGAPAPALLSYRQAAPGFDGAEPRGCGLGRDVPSVRSAGIARTVLPWRLVPLGDRHTPTPSRSAHAGRGTNGCAGGTGPAVSLALAVSGPKHQTSDDARPRAHPSAGPSVVEPGTSSPAAPESAPARKLAVRTAGDAIESVTLATWWRPDAPPRSGSGQRRGHLDHPQGDSSDATAAP